MNKNKTTKEMMLMHISKDQRLDAISGRDQMAEREPCEHAKRFMKRPAYYGVLGYLARQKAKRNKIDTGEEIGRGAETGRKQYQK